MYSGSLPGGAGFVDHAQKIALLHDQVVLTVDLHFGARPFAEQDPVSRFDVDRDQLALLASAPGTGRDNLAFLRPLLCGVGNDDATGGLFLGIDAAHEHAVVHWAEMHAHPPCQFGDVQKTGSGDRPPAKTT
jgi:hypothetical protein